MSLAQSKPAEAEERTVATDAEGNAFELHSRNCAICGVQARHVLGLRGGEHQRYRQGIVSRIVQCHQCGLVYPDPFPFPLDSQKLYGDPDKYFGDQTPETKLANNLKLVREMVERFGKQKFSLLDIGTGRGELLEAARLEGIRAVGLETSESMVREGRALWGMDIYCQTVEEFADGRDQVFDVVSLCAVLEHTHDPDLMIATVRRLTRPGSLVYIDVPREPNLMTIVGNASNRLLGRPAVYNLQPTWPPYHVFGFNPRSLNQLLAKHGFTLESISVHAEPHVPWKAGWKDRTRAFIATQLNRVANIAGLASNMYVWCRRRD